MTVESQFPYQSYTANGSQTYFALSFYVEDKTNFVVKVDESIINNTQYIYDNTTNTVKFNEPPIAGEIVTIERVTSLDRSINYSTYNNTFRPETLNYDVDRVWRKLQELDVADWIIKNRIDQLKTYVDEQDDGLRAYLLDEILKQGVALDQLENYYEYLMQRLAQIAVDKGWDTSFVTYHGITQEKINDGLESIDQLLAITNPKPAMRVRVKSYYVANTLTELNPYRGGGDFIWDATNTTTANNGTVFQANGVEIGRWLRVDVSEINVEMFGAKGDGNYDDRPAFQSAINYLHSRDGGELIVPKPIVGYRFKSYDITESACLVIPAPKRSIYLDPISIRATANLTEIRVDLGANITIEAAILLKGGGLYKKFENLSVWGGKDKNTKNCNYVLKGSDAYYPNLTIRDCQFYVAKEDCVKLSTYVTVFDKLQTAYSKRGIVVNKTDPMVASGVSGPITSITLNSCYALNHDYHGYWFGETTYCSFNSCASDHIVNTLNDGYEAYPYYIDIARGVTFNGCGAESSTRIMRVRAAQGLTINGLMTLSIGHATTPPTALIRIEGGESTVISGLWNQNSAGFSYILQLGATFGAESVTVLDQSIDPSEVTFTTNYRFENPIRFLMNDFSRKTQDNTLTNTGNAATNATNFSNLAQLAWNTELLHDNIIRFPSGDFPISATVYLSNIKTRGGGRIRLIGHADGTSRIVLQGAGGVSFGVPNQLTEMTYTIENLNLYLSATLDTSNKGVTFYKANAVFTNGKITSDTGGRQYASNFGSKVTLDANSAITTSLYGSLEVNYSYKATTAPTSSTRLPIGTMFKASDPNATRIGWINTADNGATWLPMVVA